MPSVPDEPRGHSGLGLQLISPSLGAPHRDHARSVWVLSSAIRNSGMGSLSQAPSLCSLDTFSLLEPSLGSSGQKVGFSLRLPAVCLSPLRLHLGPHGLRTEWGGKAQVRLAFLRAQLLIAEGVLSFGAHGGYLQDPLLLCQPPQGAPGASGQEAEKRGIEWEFLPLSVSAVLSAIL